ncbi:hypothetical protein BY458DRAFT_511907 [Sporodiniella umbellata]|nr:hypothetical protein BY458DRAFT_511907 [Sporodiniella umbellata]
MISFLNNNSKYQQDVLYSEQKKQTLTRSSTTMSIPELTPNNTANSTEENILPPTYARLPATKLEEEPNPFERSFEGARRTLPYSSEEDISSNASHGSVSDYSFRSNLSSPLINNEADTSNKAVKPSIKDDSNSSPNEQSKEVESKPAKKKARIEKQSTEEYDTKRKNFLERNRIAALKCRQRKKQWLQNLQAKVEYLTTDNEQYTMEMAMLREELIHLKTVLIRHKDCLIDQQGAIDALNKPIPGLLSLVQPCEYVNNVSVLQQPSPKK